MPTFSITEREAFWNTLIGSWPRFCGADQWEIPTSQVANGWRQVYHDADMSSLEELDPK